LKTPDSAVASTALFTGSTLVTRNTRDFQKVPQLSVREI
jgi:predicted nucleic acid-binding protein